MVIFLNASSQLDIHYGIHPELLELSISASASIADWAMNQGYAVGLYANTIMYIPDEEQMVDQTPTTTTLQEQLKRRRVHLPPTSNQEQRKRIMEALARIQTYFGTTIEKIMQAERSHLPIGSTVVLVTSSISEALMDALEDIRHSGHAVAILFVGNSPAPIKLAGITVYHLGGEEAWKRLAAAYSSEANGTGGTRASASIQL
jgi:uncharacterized protein (DUF58 family)